MTLLTPVALVFIQDRASDLAYTCCPLVSRIGPVTLLTPVALVFSQDKASDRALVKSG